MFGSSHITLVIQRRPVIHCMYRCFARLNKVFKKKKKCKGVAEKVLGLRFSHFVAPAPHPIINDQSLILVNFEGLFLLSPPEIKQEVCE